ncbi:MAG: type III toxin-antitoxin system ToxN/AbiQ family toxin [Firmicutes bacterium]|nr:type III toxin-antitoxin system ToxN/AbiQ family toxin [Bacillota bacterium]
MAKQLVLVKLNQDYCDFLRKFDDKVPYNYGKKELRPFVGVLFEMNQCKYFAPLSSPKPKHLKLKNKIDFLKIDKGILGAINFNNMLPVKSENIIKLDLKNKGNTESEMHYLLLLKKQLFWLNRNSDKLYKKSKLLYEKYVSGNLSPNIASRCCNFPLLEKKCNEYHN